jgi:hypothetical protein
VYNSHTNVRQKLNDGDFYVPFSSCNNDRIIKSATRFLNYDAAKMFAKWTGLDKSAFKPGLRSVI